MVRRSLVASLTTNSAPAMGTDHDPGSGSPMGNTVGWAPNCCISDSSWLGETDCELNTDHATCRRYGRLRLSAAAVRACWPATGWRFRMVRIRAPYAPQVILTASSGVRSAIRSASAA
jgi:hypothetical protein